MRRVVVACVALSGLLSAAPAFAADMPLKAPAYTPPPAPTWTGWYIGANIGGSFGTASDSATFAGVPVGGGSPNLDGVVGGGQIGYNWQANGWLFGLEADIQGTSEDGSSSASETLAVPGILPGAVTGTLSYSEKLPWFGTVRGRLGILPSPNWLLYATGGLAYGEVDTNTTLTVGAASVGNNFDTTRAGWTVGGGVEGWLSPNWTAKLEYLYVDLGSFSNTFTGVGTFTPVTLSTHVTDNIVRVGLNYHFGGPMGARY
ncbi:MAG TPA: outer membrane beta-barrel protein [Xanthobacteraceae bacterium]|nr:outer membrane beta-barrel protein [Xanthobacteraceae bacterium]